MAFKNDIFGQILMSIEKIIEESFQRGEKKVKSTGSLGATWYEYFGFNFDPFSDNFNLSDLEFSQKLFTNRIELIKETAEYIGGSKFTDSSYHISIVGSTGSGKTSILKILYLYAKQKYNLCLFDIKLGKILTSEERKREDDRIIQTEKFDCVIFDNCFSLERTKMYLEIRKKFPGLVITALKPDFIEELKPDRIIKIENFNDNDKVELIKKRIHYQQENNPFPEDYIESIFKLPIGNPFLLLSQAREIAQILFNLQKDEKNNHEIKNVFTIYLSNYLQNLQAKKEKLINTWTILSTKEKLVLKTLMKLNKLDSVTPGILEEHIQGGKTLAWKYLERLHDKKILIKEYRGKSTLYFVELFNQILLEELLLNGE